MKQILFLPFLTILFFSCQKTDDNPNVQACFDYKISNDIDTNNQFEVQFLNCSQNATNFFWDFNDGNTSTEKEPIHKFIDNDSYNVKLIAFNGKFSDTTTLLVGQRMVYKPNIYIYPQKTINLCLNLSFPSGGRITESIPDYIQGWCVIVDSTGRIDNKYDYLFYESLQPDKFQYKLGWCIAKSDLTSFFKNNMTMYNFSNDEINDFIEYWIPKLIKNKYYIIYPQINSNIDNLIQLDFSIQPDNVNRLFYGFVGIDKFTTIDEPIIKKYNRNGFYIMEWGGFIK